MDRIGLEQKIIASSSMSSFELDESPPIPAVESDESPSMPSTELDQSASTIPMELSDDNKEVVASGGKRKRKKLDDDSETKNSRQNFDAINVIDIASEIQPHEFVNLYLKPQADQCKKEKCTNTSSSNDDQIIRIDSILQTMWNGFMDHQKKTPRDQSTVAEPAKKTCDPNTAAETVNTLAGDQSASTSAPKVTKKKQRDQNTGPKIVKRFPDMERTDFYTLENIKDCHTVIFYFSYSKDNLSDNIHFPGLRDRIHECSGALFIPLLGNEHSDGKHYLPFYEKCMIQRLVNLRVKRDDEKLIVVIIVNDEKKDKFRVDSIYVPLLKVVKILKTKLVDHLLDMY